MNFSTAELNWELTAREAEGSGIIHEEAVPQYLNGEERRKSNDSKEGQAKSSDLQVHLY